MPEPKQFTVHFGCLAKPIGEQLTEQGLTDTKADLHEKLAFSISLLKIHSIITDGECKKAQTRLMAAIKKSLIVKEV